jgi:peptide/nickel transport system permease protein
MKRNFGRERVVGPIAEIPGEIRKARPFWRRAFRNVGAVLGIALLVMVSLVGIFAPQISTYDPLAIDMSQKFQPPSRQHFLGTDELGRDMFSRVVMGTRISFQVAGEVLLIAGTIGIFLGIIAGYRGGIVDEIIMRAADIFLAFPSFLLAMAIVAALGASIQNAILAIAIAWWPRYARLLRGQVLAVKNMPFVDAARSIGAGDMRVMLRHVLPNCLAPLVVQFTTDAGAAILNTSALSFVQLGARPPMPEWGLMISQGRNFIVNYWWIPTFPGLAIALAVGGFMFLGDGLRDLWDPQLRGRGRF